MNLQTTFTKPDAAEYAAYYGKYVALVPVDREIISVLHRQLDETLELLRGIPEADGNTRYAPDKWSIKEVVGHVADTERIFAYRALRFARGDATPLPGFEQDAYVVNARFDDCNLAELAAEFESVRRATIALLKPLTKEAWQRSGIASDNPVSVRALAYIIAGHELHHRNILLSRYLEAVS
ncbi:MAG: DinB family protein [Pyrinomonadaceae bacterium MAG19_C2-C3]|nr:DinB family protein [Pyrinomonadaceae bacterium MAG19_C2-C3]